MAAGPTDDLDAELREAENRIQEIYDKILKGKHVDEDKNKEAKCWDFYDRLKPKHPCSQQLKINFRTGKTNLEALKTELENALVKEKRGKVSDNARKKVEMFVSLIDDYNKIGKQVTDEKSAVDMLKKVGAPLYMQHRLIELSKAEKVRWDTDDVSIKRDMTNFWEVSYGHRKLIEADKLWRILKSDDSKRHAPTRALLPMMYWLKDMKGRSTWAGWNPYNPKSEPDEIDPPDWALEYIRTKRAQRDVLLTKMKQRLFQPSDKPCKDRHPNAVYLLLCRFFNGEGASKEAKVQAYAGKASNGVELRWIEHASASKVLIHRFSELEKFSDTPLDSVTLVEVVVGRLYAEGQGRKFITETDVDSHDNIALFVYRAYGENAKGDNTKANTKRMEKTEGDLIRDLELTAMECGLNKIQPKKKENEAENAKNAEAGDKAKKEDVKKTE